MTDIIIAKTIVLVLVGLSALMLIIAVFKRESDQAVRALVFGLIFLGVFIFLQNTKMKKLSLPEIKKVIFPSKVIPYQYAKDENLAGNVRTTRYTFLEEQGPKLSLTIDTKGNYFHITDSDVESVNRVLEYMGLKKLSHGVQELSSITGSRLDTSSYRWNDYDDGGTLILERTICHDKQRYNTYNCISVITVIKRL